LQLFARSPHDDGRQAHPRSVGDGAAGEEGHAPATERFYHAPLLVLTAYKPKTHNIEGLGTATAVLRERARHRVLVARADRNRLDRPARRRSR
jgi:hypothetical protein